MLVYPQLKQRADIENYNLFNNQSNRVNLDNKKQSNILQYLWSLKDGWVQTKGCLTQPILFWLPAVFWQTDDDMTQIHLNVM